MTFDAVDSSTRLAPRAPLQALPYDSLAMDAESLKRGVLAHLEYTLAELPEQVDSDWEPYMALALAVRDRMIQRWIRTQDTYYRQDAKRVYYLSLEYLMGRTLGNSLINMGLRSTPPLPSPGGRPSGTTSSAWLRPSPASTSGAVSRSP